MRKKHGQTPLHQASCAGHIDVITQLLDHGADIEAKDSSGNTPLLSAVSYTGGNWVSEKDERTINYLLQHGADIGAANEDGQSAAQLIDLMGYYVNKAGELESKASSHAGKVQDVCQDEDMAGLW